MGKKEAPAKKPEAAKKEEPKKEDAKVEAEALKPEEEDPPIVQELKVLDDKYLALEREYEKEVAALHKKYTEMQKPFLDERKKLLTTVEDGGDASTGTPAVKGFWLHALKNHEGFDFIEDWDEPVLEYLTDITTTVLSEDDLSAGFKLQFFFSSENPYFTNTVLEKIYETKETSPYIGEVEPLHIKVTEIDWKPGKDVTVEKTKKTTKGGGAKKAKQKGKEKVEPRASFFRRCFCELRPDMEELPEGISMFMDNEEDEDDEDEEMIKEIMAQDYELGCVLKDNIIPYAVRWYTDEAEPNKEEDDDSDDDDDEDDDPKPKAKAKSKGG